MSSDESVFVELHGIDPEDIPHGLQWDGEANDAATDLANDIYALVDQEYPFDVNGVATVVNQEKHESLNDVE